MTQSLAKRIKSTLLGWYGRSPLKLFVLRVASCSELLAGLFLLLTGSFGREHQCTIAGRCRHFAELKAGSLNGAVYTLRRNTHRIEKGLIMRPRRSTFALGYIDETVSVYTAIVGNSEAASKNIKLVEWANDVLTHYFTVVSEDDKIVSARRLFEMVDNPKPANEPKIPYVRDLAEMPAISIEQLEALAIRRRSCRWFLQKPVPRALIDKAVKVACFAPSACNRQPFEFLFFDDLELVSKVAALPGGTVGFSQNFPCVMVIVGDFSAFPFDRDRHVPYIDASLAAMGLQFALEVQGISSCCINWPDVADKEKAVSELLSLRRDQRVIMMMAVGYPDQTAMVPYSQKKSLEEIRHFNRIQGTS